MATTMAAHPVGDTVVVVVDVDVVVDVVVDVMIARVARTGFGATACWTRDGRGRCDEDDTAVAEITALEPTPTNSRLAATIRPYPTTDQTSDPCAPA